MTRADEPLDLDAAAPEEQPRAADGGSPRRWVALAAAVAVGVVVGLVVAEARDDAAASGDVRVVSGALRGSGGGVGGAAPVRVELSLLNLGEHEIEIIGFEPPGMTLDPDDDPADAVVAPPGEWVAVAQGGLVADCDLADPGDVVRVRVRDGAGTEQVVEAGGAPEFGGGADAWHTACQTYGLAFGITDVSTVTHDAESLTMDLPVTNGGSEAMQVNELEPQSAGLEAAAPEVPFDVPPGLAVTAPLTWTVTDCQAALRWPEVLVDYDVTGADSAASGSHPLFGRARAELVLLVQRVCGNAR